MDSEATQGAVWCSRINYWGWGVASQIDMARSSTRVCRFNLLFQLTVSVLYQLLKDLTSHGPSVSHTLE
jgi:hypothetical protein